MELILPEITITWQSSGSQSTVDLKFIPNPLLGSVMRCQPSEDLDSGSDHIPIVTEPMIKLLREEKSEPRPQWKKANWDALNQEMETKLSKLPVYEPNLATSEAIDLRARQVTQIIQEIIEELVPKANPSRFSKPYRTTKCTQAIKKARKARRM